MNLELTRLGMAMIKSGMRHCQRDEWGDFQPAIFTPVSLSDFEYYHISNLLDVRYQEPPCA